jgi:hypothetical protein
MPPIGKDDPEMSYRRGYEHGAVETFRAVERFLDAATREVLRVWIQEDVHGWRYKGNARRSADLAAEHVKRSQVTLNLKFI